MIRVTPLVVRLVLASFFGSLGLLGCGSTDNGASPGAGGGSNGGGSNGGAEPTLDGATSSFPSTPLATFKTSDKLWAIELRMAPQQPLHVGPGEAELRITDATGQPVDGLSVNVVPYAPVMQHGTPLKAKVTDEGSGVYHAVNVSPSMPGKWELKLTLKATLPDGGAGATETAVSPSFDVIED